jgi:hypothetical protein
VAVESELPQVQFADGGEERIRGHHPIIVGWVNLVGESGRRHVRKTPIVSIRPAGREASRA